MLLKVQQLAKPLSASIDTDSELSAGSDRDDGDHVVMGDGSLRHHQKILFTGTKKIRIYPGFQKSTYYSYYCEVT